MLFYLFYCLCLFVSSNIISYDTQRSRSHRWLFSDTNGHSAIQLNRIG